MAMKSAKAAGNTYVGAANRDGLDEKGQLDNWRDANRIYESPQEDKADIDSGKMAPDARTKPAEVKVHELITEARSRIQKADTFECRLDIDVVIKQLSEILKAIA